MDALEAEIRKAVADGYKTFLYGGALGVDTLAASDRIIYVDNKKKMAALAARDQYVVDCSSRLIAVCDERSHLHSGTYRALCYAKEKGLEIRQICWINFV